MRFDDPYGEYLESQVLTASPLELVEMLVRAARDATRAAREHLAAGRIRERARQISKAHAILAQLSTSLDHSRGGPLSLRLAALYDYIQRRLLEANFRQHAEPLVEAESLLTTLLEGWEQTAKAGQPQAAPPSAPEPGGASAEYRSYPNSPFFAAETACFSQSWSL